MITIHLEDETTPGTRVCDGRGYSGEFVSLLIAQGEKGKGCDTCTAHALRIAFG